MGRILRAAALAVALCLILATQTTPRPPQWVWIGIDGQGKYIPFGDFLGAVQNGLPQGGSTSGLAVQSSGVAVGTRVALNVLPGAGVSTFVSDDGKVVSLQIAADTAVMQTHANNQNGADLLCEAKGTNGAYACGLTPTLTVPYKRGMVVHFIPDLSSAPGISLDIDAFGARPVKQGDGATDAAVTGGWMYDLWFDGQVFRIR